MEDLLAAGEPQLNKWLLHLKREIKYIVEFYTCL